MPTFAARVREDGSVVLPAELRERLNIKPNAEVEFFLTIDGQVHFHHLTDVFTAFGSRISNPPISIREMDDAIADYLVEKHAPPSEKAKRARKPAAE